MLLATIVAGLISVVLRALTPFATPFMVVDTRQTAIYIPVFNTRIFYQRGIGWEWGLVIGMTLVFVAFSEVWKIIRRPLFKRWTNPVVGSV